MLSADEIKQSLHASRVLPLSAAKPHGPLELFQLVAEVSCINLSTESGHNLLYRPHPDCET